MFQDDHELLASPLVQRDLLPLVVQDDLGLLADLVVQDDLGLLADLVVPGYLVLPVVPVVPVVLPVPQAPLSVVVDGKSAFPSAFGCSKWQAAIELQE